MLQFLFKISFSISKPRTEVDTAENRNTLKYQSTPLRPDATRALFKGTRKEKSLELHQNSHIACLLSSPVSGHPDEDEHHPPSFRFLEMAVAFKRTVDFCFP